MGREIERKYLVKGEYKSIIDYSIPIKQGYILGDSNRTVRVRLTAKKAYLTIKGKQDGISRFEWEKEIPVDEAEELLTLCSDNIIEKTRHIIKHGKHTIEVDEFRGKNTGLVLAEIELNSEDENIDLPDWLGDEVSYDFRYHNSNLSINPFSDWDKKNKIQEL